MIKSAKPLRMLRWKNTLEFEGQSDQKEKNYAHQTVLNRSIKSNTSNKVATIIFSKNYAREKLKILSPQANPMYR